MLQRGGIDHLNFYLDMLNMDQKLICGLLAV